jgi:hypothetical protein
MSNPSDSQRHRVIQYANARQLILEDSLGYGKDGIVFSSNRGVAVKVYSSQSAFEAERDCYFRLAEHQVIEVLGHNVPQMIAWSNSLLVIEMTIVKPPYILDFASARLDATPDFSPEVMEQWEHDRFEEFGNNWGHVQVIMQIMRETYGIYLLDVHPRNITFGENDP